MAIVKAAITESFWLDGLNELVVLIEQPTLFATLEVLDASIERPEGCVVRGTAKQEFLRRHVPGKGPQEFEAFRLQGIDKAGAPVGAVLTLSDQAA